MNTGIVVLVGVAIGAILLGRLWRTLQRRVSRGTQALRFDGIYQSEHEDNYWCYLRFYSDSTVLTASSTGAPAEVVRWFRREDVTSKKLSHGRYVVRGNHVSFSSKKEFGT